MSAKSPDSLTVDLGKSRALIVVLGVVYGGAAVLGVLLPIVVSIRVALVTLIAAGLVRDVRIHGLRRARDAVVALSLDDDGCALRRRSSTDWEEGRLIGKSVYRSLAIVVIRVASRRWPTGVVVCADAVPREAFRRLRVRLRLQAVAPESYRDPRNPDRGKDSPV